MGVHDSCSILDRKSDTSIPLTCRTCPSPASTSRLDDETRILGDESGKYNPSHDGPPVMINSLTLARFVIFELIDRPHLTREILKPR